MGEVAVIPSEPLHFECKDAKHMPEKDVYTPQSNAEHMPEEETSQSADHKITNDLREKGYLQYG